MKRFDLAWRIAKKPTALAIFTEIFRETFLSDPLVLKLGLGIAIFLIPVYIGYIGRRITDFSTTLLALILFSLGETFALVVVLVTAGDISLLDTPRYFFILPLLFFFPMIAGYVIARLLKR